MTKREQYEQRTETLLLPIIEKNRFELVDVEYVKEGGTWYLRAYIDKPGGITVDDCEVVNRALGELLDEEDFMEKREGFLEKHRGRGGDPHLPGSGGPEGV